MSLSKKKSTSTERISANIFGYLPAVAYIPLHMAKVSPIPSPLKGLAIRPNLFHYKRLNKELYSSQGGEESQAGH